MWRYPFIIRLCLGVLALVQLSPAQSKDRIQVITTTTDLRSLTEVVGGDAVDALNLVPANFDAEEYQPKPQDVLRLKNARLVVRVGLDYDLWFDRLLQASARADIQRGGPAYVDASYGIAALEVRGVSFGAGDGLGHGRGNPLFGLGFAYFLEIKPGVPPTPSHLAGIIQRMRARGVRIVVREPHEPERDVAFVAQKTGASVVVLAATVGGLPAARDYFSLFETNVGALVEAAGAR